MPRVYVYALVDRSPGRVRPERPSLRVLSFGDVSAVIERRSTPPDISEASLRDQHDVVNDLARRFDAILPARFGAFIDTDELRRLVEARRGVLHDAFDRVRGQEQMTVRIYGTAPDPVPATQQEQTGTTYLERRRAAAHAPLTGVAQALRTTVMPLVTAETVEPGRAAVLAVIHHLIPRGHASQYLDRILSTISKEDLQNVATISGPFAPYAFAPDIWS
jgi:gas vesicle protein GvpL/GvpF